MLISLDELAECVMAALGSTLSLQQLCRAADGLLHLADDPSQSAWYPGRGVCSSRAVSSCDATRIRAAVKSSAESMLVASRPGSERYYHFKCP